MSEIRNTVPSRRVAPVRQLHRSCQDAVRSENIEDGGEWRGRRTTVVRIHFVARCVWAWVVEEWGVWGCPRPVASSFDVTPAPLPIYTAPLRSSPLTQPLERLPSSSLHPLHLITTTLTVNPSSNMSGHDGKHPIPQTRPRDLNSSSRLTRLLTPISREARRRRPQGCRAQPSCL